MSFKTKLNASSPDILTVVGIAAFLGAIGLAIKAAPRANDILEEMEDAPTLEKVKMVAPFYAPVVGSACVGVGAILMSRRILNTRYAENSLRFPAPTIGTLHLSIQL